MAFVYSLRFDDGSLLFVFITNPILYASMKRNNHL